MGDRRNVMWLYPWDAADEGAEVVTQNIQERAGLNGIAVAVAYHSGMFLLPHNPRRKLLFPQPSLFIQPDMSRFRSLALQPIVNDLADSGIVDQIRKSTRSRGMELTAWVVACHNSGIGEQYPEVTSVNAFGDRHQPHLCPANPDLRAYLVALCADLAHRDFDVILLESIEYMGFQHGYHHG
jgi:hypothetical protein